jgi:hypothetical protein
MSVATLMPSDLAQGMSTSSMATYGSRSDMKDPSQVLGMSATGAHSHSIISSHDSLLIYMKIFVRRWQ